MKKNVIGDRYEILSCLGKGGMGAVYRALDTRLLREVALKMMHDEGEGDEALYYFQREARAAAALHHPSIVQVYDYSGPQESPRYIVMELVTGKALDEVASHTKLSETTLLTVGESIAGALAHAHAADVIHRDVKPANIIVANDGRMVLTDFGLAKAFLDPNKLGDTVASRLTALVGTPAFLAPEQINEQTCGPDSDVFSLGATLYAAATGASPFYHADVVEILRLIVENEYVPLAARRPDLSGDFVDLVGACLAPTPYERPRAADIESRCRRLLHERWDGRVEGETSTELPTQRVSKTLSPSSPQTQDSSATTDDADHVKTIRFDENEVAAAIHHRKTQAVTAPVSDEQHRQQRKWLLMSAGLALVVVLAVALSFRLAQNRSRGRATPAAPILQPIPTTKADPVPTIAPTPQEETEVIPAPPQKTPRARERSAPDGKPTTPDPVVHTPPTVTTVRILVEPWGTVYLDGNRVGNTPLVRALSANSGKHTVSVVHPEFGEQKKVVVFGKQDLVRFTLEH